MEQQTRRTFLRNAALAGVAVPFGGAILAGCGGTTSTDAKKTAGPGGTILVAPPVALSAAGYWNTWTTGAVAATKALGLGAHTENFNGSTSAQLSAFQSMTSLGLKGAITEANTPAVSPRLMKYCQAEKIYGVNSWSNQPWSTPLDIGPYYVSYMEFANDLAFEAVCSFLFSKLHGPSKVLHVSGTAGTLPSEYRDLGLKEALKKFPNVQLVATEYGNYSTSETATVVQSMLTAHPDVQAIICQNDDSAVGALSVLRNEGKSIPVIGCDATTDFLDAMIAGRGLATVANSGLWLGGAQVVELYDAMHGYRLPPLERMQRFEAFVINTPAAAAEYKRIMYSGSSPFDYERMSRVRHPDDWDMQIGVTAASPETLWSKLAPKKPAGYSLPAAYRNATAQDYAAVDAKYKQHLTNDVFAPVKKLCKPLVVVD